jgi:RNA polymerase sigma factor (sigma-70 family)
VSDAARPVRVPPEDLLAHADWARELAAHLVRDAATADDLVQDALAAAIEKPPLADRPVRPWLAAVIRKLALARRRGDGRRGRRENVVGVAAATRPTPSGADVVARLDAHRVLAAAVGDLPEPLRATVYLRYYEGLDSTEIARRHGVAAETVRWRLAKALDELRVRLDAGSPGGRAEWLAALAPIALPRLAPTPAGPASSPAPGAAVLTGVLAMTLTTKILLGGAAAAALLALFWSTDVAKSDGSSASTKKSPEVDVASTARPREEKHDAPAKTPRRRSGAETTAPAPEDPTKTADASARTKTDALRLEVRAHVLDFAGAAAAGARVECVDGATAPGALADADSGGRVSFVLSADAGTVSLEFVVSAARCATRVVDGTPPREGGVLDLGDVKLAAGGSVAGRVVDTAGAPVDGAWVGVVDADVDYVRAAPRAASGADGRFVIRDVPVGRPQIAAGKQGFETKRLGVDVRPNEEAFGAVIVVDRDDPSVRVRGVVRTPDGAVAPRAIVTYRADGGGSMSVGTTSVDAEGRFDIEGGKDKAWQLSARGDPRDNQGGWSASPTVNVRSGAEGVELRLTAARWAEVCVTRTDGKPAERYEVMLQAPDGLVLDRLLDFDHAGGVAKFKIPGQTFALVATAPGCAVATVGPIDPSKLDKRIEVLATVLPGIRGRVVALGAPVAHARVTLREVVKPGMREIRNGFACFSSAVMPDVAADTADDGSFELTLREAGKFIVRAESPEFAPAEVGPFDLVPDVGRADVALSLTKGGAIEGRVLAAPGGVVDGVIVGASRGDGEARTVRVGPDGAFRFDRLTPGQWLVKKTEREIRPGSVSVMTTVGEARFDWTCKVDDGAATHFDVDLRVEAGTAVRGELRVDGTPAAGWKTTLIAGTSIFGEETSAVVVAESGAFRMSAPLAGDYFACATSPKGLHLFAPVKVGAAETSVAFDLRTGQVKVAGVAQGDPLFLLWEDVGGRCAISETGAGADGSGGPTQFPAGRVRLVRATVDQADPRKWPTVVEGDLSAGGTIVLEVPAK